MKIIFTYFLLFIGIFSLLTFIPKTGGYIWQPELINTVSALLLTLLVFLVGQISGTSATHTGIIGTAIFTLLFCPNSYMFFSRDEQAVIELISVCIVPFFISQYHRIESKNFKYGYFIMLLMGIFCSYTHDGITIPLCLSLKKKILWSGLLANGYRICDWNNPILAPFGISVMVLFRKFSGSVISNSYRIHTTLGNQGLYFRHLAKPILFGFPKTQKTPVAYFQGTQAIILLPAFFCMYSSICASGDGQCHSRSMLLLYVLGLIPIP